MSFNRFSILTFFTVTLLAVTIYGRPHTDGVYELEPNMAKHGFVGGGTKDIKTIVFRPNIKRGYGVVGWMKNKLGLSSTNTVVQPPDYTDNVSDETSTPYSYPYGANENDGIYGIETFETTTVESDMYR